MKIAEIDLRNDKGFSQRIDAIIKEIHDFDELTFESVAYDGKKNLCSFYNDLYDYAVDSKYDAFIVYINNIQQLEIVWKSNIQLSQVPILFMLDMKFLPAEIIKKFGEECVKVRNLHVCYEEGYNLDPVLNIHKIEDANSILELLKGKRFNKRRYIGWRYHVNELRQKIKFNYDILRFVLSAKVFSPIIPYGGDGDKIPKIIHFCWFGRGKYPEIIVKCMETWKEKLPDYTIKCWNEDNFPIDQYQFAKEAFEQKKWVFVADVARTHAAYTEGGIILDTDMEVIRSFDDLLYNNGFASYESDNLIQLGAFGFRPHHTWNKLLLRWYSLVHCDVDYMEIASTKIAAKIMKHYYGIKLNGKMFETPDGFKLYTRDYFIPDKSKDGWMTTDNTRTIHYGTGLW